MPAHGAASSPSHVLDRARDALAAPGLAAVAQLDRLVLAGRGAGGDRRAAERARLELDVDLDGRVAARVEDLAGVDAARSGSSQRLLGELVVARPARRAAAGPALALRSAASSIARSTRSRNLRDRRPQRELRDRR